MPGWQNGLSGLVKKVGALLPRLKPALLYTSLPSGTVCACTAQRARMCIRGRADAPGWSNVALTGLLPQRPEVVEALDRAPPALYDT
jgi:hypothetical protein